MDSKKELMRIVPSYQSGGGLDALFTTYTPVQVASQSTGRPASNSQPASVKNSSKDSDDDTKGDLTKKDLYSMVKDIDGLDNEMDVIKNGLMRFIKISNLLGSDSATLEKTYLKTLIEIKQAKQNKQDYVDAMKKSQADSSLGEVAITLGGSLLAQNKKGNVIQLSLDDYRSNPEEYKLLSNANLAYFRKYSPNMAFTQNSDAFEIISNGMGYESFKKLLDGAKSSLGNYKYEETGLIGKQALLGLKALQGKSDEEKKALLSSVIGENVNYTMTSDSNTANVAALVQYLSGILPKRARVWAAVKTGLSESDAIKTLITSYLASDIKQTDILKITPQTKKGSSESSDGSDNSSDFEKIKTTASWKLLNGDGKKELFTIVKGANGGGGYNVMSNSMPLTDAEGKPIGVNSTMQDVSRGEFSGILDLANATIGGQAIDTSAVGSMILRDNKIRAIDCPYIERNGTIIPLFESEEFKKKQKIDEKLRMNGIDVLNKEQCSKYYEVVNNAYKDAGLEIRYSADGTPENWKRFGVINVAAWDKALGLDDMDDISSLKEITEDSTIDNLREITKNTDFVKKGFWNSIFGGYDRFYEGNLWVPLNTDYFMTGVKTNVAQDKEIAKRQNVLDIRAEWKTPPTL